MLKRRISINSIKGCQNGVLSGGNDGIVACTNYELTKSKIIHEFKNTQIEEIIVLSKNEYLVITYDKGVFLITNDGKIKNNFFTNDKTIDAFFYDGDMSVLFVGSGRSLYQIDLENYSLELLHEDFSRGSILSIERLSNSTLAIGCFQSTVFIFDFLSKSIINEIYLKEGFSVEAMHKLNNFLVVGGSSMSYSNSVSAYIDLNTNKVYELQFCNAPLSKIFSDISNLYLVCGNVSVISHNLNTLKFILEVPHKSANSLWILHQDIYVNGGSSQSFLGGWIYKYTIKRTQPES
jgi:hypothetical protein